MAVEALDAPELESCWTDDMTFGWIYQYWNDPEREALDEKLNSGGKIEPHEIASKTQMFTERYMVDWLLQNSLGPMWLAMCKKHGWTPEVEADGTLERLEQRRVEWRAKRDAGEVALTELMPLHTDAERRWAYYVPQPIPDDAVQHASESVRDLKIRRLAYLGSISATACHYQSRTASFCRSTGLVDLRSRHLVLRWLRVFVSDIIRASGISRGACNSNNMK